MVLEHLNTRVSDKAMARITAECERRFEIEAARVSMGRIINELVMHHLPPTEAELAAMKAEKKAGRKAPHSIAARGTRTRVRIAQPAA